MKTDKIDELIKNLQHHKKELETLDELRDEIQKLPNTPPGFCNSAVSKIRWTAKWVKDNWHSAKAIDEVVSERDAAIRRAEKAESRVEDLEGLLKRVTDAVPNDGVSLAENGD